MLFSKHPVTICAAHTMGLNMQFTVHFIVSYINPFHLYTSPMKN